MRKIICFNIINIYLAGGMERMCTSLANSLVDEGYVIHIVSFETGKDLIPFFYISDKVKLYNLLPTDFEKRINCHVGWLGYAQWKYKRYIKNHQVEAIIDVGTRLTPFSAPIAKKLRIPHIAWDHFCYQFFVERPSHKQILSYLKNDVDKLVLLTDRDCKNYINLASMPTEKVVRIYNFSPIEEDYYISHDSNKVLAMGRLQSEKGFDLLLQSWKFVEEKNKEWELEIVGDGPERQNLLGLISHLDLKHVKISPSTNNPRSKYLSASIFVLSSRFEGFGLVLIEAANMSLPIVSFACDNGPKELLEDGKNGYLVPVGDTNGMAEKLHQLMINPELRRSMGLHALKSMNKFRKEVIVKKWIEIIDNV